MPTLASSLDYHAPTGAAGWDAAIIDGTQLRESKRTAAVRHSIICLRGGNSTGNGPVTAWVDVAAM